MNNIFTVGDKTNKGTILKFEIFENLMLVLTSDCGWYPLDYIQHTKQPLFQTEDGVDIFEGDKYWVVDSNFNIYSSHGGNFIDLMEEGKFSTKEKAQEYIDLHKPKYGKKDIEEAIQKISVSINGGSWNQDILNVSFDKFWEKLDG